MTSGDAAKRESWGNHCEFFLTSLGLAVGLGNVWRFPYVCYTNGGGSFLIAYLIMLFVVGIPAFFLELSVGQYGRVGANKVFGRMVPLFKGLGYGMLCVRFLVNTYYVVIQAWATFYLFAGMRTILPWGTCEDKWNTWDCYTVEYADDCFANNETYYNQTCISREEYCTLHGFDDWLPANETVPGDNETAFPDGCFGGVGDDGAPAYFAPFEAVLEENVISPAEDYFNGYVLDLTKDASGAIYDWSDYGTLRWDLCLCLLLSWILVGLSLWKGLQSLGKVAYVITLSPYFVLTALLGYAATLEGAGKGIDYFLTPVWDEMLNPNLWSAAASQILFSLSVGYGSQLVLSSYNNFKNNTHRDAILIALCNSLTSIYAGFVVFSILGFIQSQTGAPMDSVVKGGISLAFVSYPTAVLEMDGGPAWSFFFFFMLINLAMSSICGGVQTAVAFVLDEWPSLNRHKTKIVAGFCTLFFLLGLSMCTNGGIHLFTLFDKRCTSSLLFLSLLEMVAVSWFYGVNRFLGNISEMGIWMNEPLRWVWRFMLVVATPAILAFITITSWIDHEDMEWEGEPYPDSVQAVGWVMELVPLVPLLLYPAWLFYKKAGKEGLRGKELWAAVLEPTDGWYSVDRGEGDDKAAEAAAPGPPPSYDDAVVIKSKPIHS